MKNIRDINKMLILVADDDEDDQLFTKEAFYESKLHVEIHFVNNGLELLDYLKKGNDEKRPMPALILLDLNMPKMDGREALKEIKSNHALKMIPVVALTTSKAEQDILKTYELGINSFITKPVSIADFIEIAQTLGHYWLEIVQLPQNSQK
ncbi:Response regulator rcp1 [Emticicia aquatica]|jgi:CheY-like chemotaxis protein|uniref:Response regulator rcp1 n=1 Tax=Emticicia aquatica TaxID=1681835 RepID=A0ABN8EWD4_9BACT|nr:response regulator [Emticicia aquatica]CAH0996048.1 Response regulator rcp1 [Emticicia aquatica]